MLKIRNFIAGKPRDAVSGATLEKSSPATGELLARLPDSSAEDVDLAVAAAAEAFPAWSQTPAAERSKVLLRIAALLEADLPRLAMAECLDTGKPLSLARSMDIPRAVANFRFFATAILHTRSESHFTDHLALNYTLRQPRGVVGLITPWNLPLYLLSWKVAPALAAGNTVVAKPSELTPTTAFMLSKICRKAGLPPGVLNIVHGLGAKAGAAIAAHPGINTISFTGGTATGAAIASAAAPSFKKVALELGGKNPTILFADADLKTALDTTLKSAFSNQGQICLCGSRIFVQESIYKSFAESFTRGALKLKVGDPLKLDVDQGAIVSQAQLDKIRYYVDLARKEGGKILCGGRVAKINGRCRKGLFFEPTVIAGLSAGSRVNSEEIFGPVAALIPFKTEEEVITSANATDYGLSASIWTRDLGRAHRLAEKISSGTVWVNCWLLRDLRVPFGGMKKSGLGREGGEEALRFFTEPKNVCVRLQTAA